MSDKLLTPFKCVARRNAITFQERPAILMSPPVDGVPDTSSSMQATWRGGVMSWTVYIGASEKD